jgi:hypothetical protein
MLREKRMVFFLNGAKKGFLKKPRNPKRAKCIFPELSKIFLGRHVPFDPAL